MAELIEAARRLAASGFTPWEDSCHLTCDFCGADFAGEDGGQHAPGCPWLSMPAIVAVLQAADRLIATERRRYPSRLLPRGSRMLGLAEALYGRPTAIVVARPLPSDPA